MKEFNNLSINAINKVNIQALIDIIESNTDFRVIEKLGDEVTLRLYDTDIKIIKEYYN